VGGDISRPCSCYATPQNLPPGFSIHWWFSPRPVITTESQSLPFTLICLFVCLSLYCWFGLTDFNFSKVCNLWWLILCVNLTGPQGAQIKHYFWVYLWCCFWMRLAIECLY
jgi:hypothetical protein